MCQFKPRPTKPVQTAKLVAREEIPVTGIDLAIPSTDKTVVTIVKLEKDDNGKIEIKAKEVFHVEHSKDVQPVQVTKDAYDIDAQFILDQEMGGRSYYDKKLQSPAWPGASSGVTWGAGFDAGYNTVQEIKDSWKGYIPDHDIDRLTRYAGITGLRAKNLTAEVKDIKIPYNVAVRHFNEKTLPRFIKQTEQAFGSIKGLPRGQQTALVSLVFNRGPSLVGKKREEMMAISKAMANGKYDKIPSLIREMKRLWSLKGLLRRRDEEALLFASGLKTDEEVVA